MTREFLGEAATLKDAATVIETTKKSIAVVVDSHHRILGTISDGDIRRALLADLGLDSKVGRAMNRSPICVQEETTDLALLSILQENGIEAAPVIDDQRRVIRVAHYRDFDADAPVGGGEGFFGAVIMAGGLGKRLGPFTKTTPKPLVDVGGMPLIERQIRNLVRAGVVNIFVSINHLGNLIEEHLGDGANLGANVTYLRENTRLGTAGSLSLLPCDPDGPLLVMNGDIITSSDYANILRFHLDHRSDITVAAVEYVIEVPFGVINTSGSRITGLVEKPTQRFRCNAGIYVVSGPVLSRVPKGTYYDMTSLIDDAIEDGMTATAFPIHEYWTDIGTPNDLTEARERLAAVATEKVGER